MTTKLRTARRRITMARSTGAAVPPRKAPDLKSYGGRVAARIRALREASGMTPEVVAEKMTARGYQISRAAIYHWETGAREPALDALPVLAKVLGLSGAGEFFPDR